MNQEGDNLDHNKSYETFIFSYLKNKETEK